jgi:hypothetical protein
MDKFLKKQSIGAAALEASLTLPIVLTMFFFMIETVRLNNARSAMDSIALEATMDFVTNKDTKKFTDIMNRYKPHGIPTENIKYYFNVYENLEEMCSRSTLGNEAIYYPESNLTPSEQNITGKAFVLVFVCEYNFSSDLVGKFFSKNNEKFLISGRGVGICH